MMAGNDAEAVADTYKEQVLRKINHVHTKDRRGHRFHRLAVKVGQIQVHAQPAGAEAASVPQQSADAGLTKELSNLVTDLISAPFQFNYDRGIGPQDDGDKLTASIPM